MQWTAIAEISCGMTHDMTRAFSVFNTPGFRAGSGNRLGDAIMACSNGTVLTEWRPDSG
ncbi:hypothetical protein [Burkholderia sp. S171]|uniref:hypothetical protein n=1 Tax=Burkholderia sp. S171 TaxID=1641860 RepID=UPI00131BC3FB|nr:hypothetical protein [Burkholderia sp. S171]